MDYRRWCMTNVKPVLESQLSCWNVKSGAKMYHPPPSIVASYSWIPALPITPAERADRSCRQGAPGHLDRYVAEFRVDGLWLSLSTTLPHLFREQPTGGTIGRFVFYVRITTIVANMDCELSMFGYGNPIIFILIGHNYFFMTGVHRFLPSDWMLKLTTDGPDRTRYSCLRRETAVTHLPSCWSTVHGGRTDRAF